MVSYHDDYKSETSFQVLTNPHHVKLRWIPGFPNKEIPIDIGVKADSHEKNPFYIGRIQRGSSLLMGRVLFLSKNFFYATEDKQSHKGEKYALLVVANDQN